MRDELAARVAALAADRESGASELLARALDLVQEARRAGSDMAGLARALARAQPSMAPMWNLGLSILQDASNPGALDRFAEAARRAGPAIERWAVACLRPDVVSDRASRASRVPFRLITVSRSRAVASVVAALARHGPVHAICAEGRPALEGRHQSAQLLALGATVEICTDAALAHALVGTDAVVVGADAVCPGGWVNKVGTRMLAAAAAQVGCPVYVVAARDKFVGPLIAAALEIREGDAREVWPDPPEGIHVRNPYFEVTPLELATQFITDTGVLSPTDVAAICARIEERISPPLVAQLVSR